MLRGIILCCCVFFSFIAKAHQPDISTTMLVEKDSNQWILQINGALTGFQYAIKAHYGDSAYDSPEAFQDLVLAHLKENLNICINDKETVSFKNGFVQLGHETKVGFEVIGIPKEIKSIQFKNSSFKDIYHNQSALVILKKGVESNQFLLNNENQHELKLVRTGNQFKLVDEATKNSSYIIGILILLGLTIGFYVLNKKFNLIKTT